MISEPVSLSLHVFTPVTFEPVSILSEPASLWISLACTSFLILDLSELAFGFEPVTYSLSMYLISKPCIFNSVGQQLI